MGRPRPQPKRKRPACAFGRFTRLPRRVVRGWDAIKDMAGHQPVGIDEIRRKHTK